MQKNVCTRYYHVFDLLRRCRFGENILHQNCICEAISTRDNTSFNPYLWIVDKKTTNREYDEASFVDKKSTQNLKSWFLGMSGSVICGQKIHINFFEKIRKIGFWECHGASFVDKKSTLIFFLKNSKNWVLEMSWSVKFGQRNYAYPLEY